MAMITNDWLTALGGEFHKPYYRQLFEFVKDEYNTTVVFPPADDIFNAFHLTPLSKVKVVILGQDPYHNVGQAHDSCCRNRMSIFLLPWSIFTRNSMMILDVIFNNCYLQMG